MTGEKGKRRISAKSDGKFALEIGRKRRELTFEETFAYGHAFLKSKKYAAAAGIFKTLLEALGVDRPMMIMLAPQPQRAKPSRRESAGLVGGGAAW